MADPDAYNDPPHQTRAPRQSVFLHAKVERFGTPEVTSHRVHDLSCSGMRLDKAGMLMSGATIVVTVGALEAIGATVVWVKEDQAGIRFVKPIDPDQARARTALHAPDVSTPRGPSAGWVPNLANPYGKRD